MAGKPEWVFDTNVVVSGLLKPGGPPGRLIDAVLADILGMVCDDRILAEYQEVLGRPKFGFDPARRQAFCGLLAWQRHVTAMPVRGLQAAELQDTVFLEVAAASAKKILVTGNLRHFPAAGRGKVEVLTPAEAMHRLFPFP